MNTRANSDQDTARRQAESQVESIVQMVAALECDYDRLEELKDELEGLTDAVATAQDDLDSALEDETATVPQCEQRLLVALAARDDWEAANREELDELTQAAGDCADADEARERIQEDPLSVEVRSAWANVGETLTPDEYRVVLCTGGPHVELVGDLNQYAEAANVRVLYRDWGDSGEYFPTDDEGAALMTYLGCLYFGS